MLCGSELSLRALGVARSVRSGPLSSLFARLPVWLSRPRAHLLIALVACVLFLPSVSDRLVLDDHVLALKARQDTGLRGLHAEPLSLFTFTTGRPEDNHAMMDEGVLLPWWTEPEHLNAFFRPLSSLTHLLDFALWPSAPWAMHVHSLAWYLALLLALAHVYRRLGGAPDDDPSRQRGHVVVAMLALWLYAVDDAHAATVAWVANRNAIVAATLAVPVLSSLHRYRAEGFRAGAWLGPCCFALGLCAGETAIAMLGYVVAYLFVLDRSTWASRARALAPYLALLVAHRIVYRVLGLGSFGSSAYHDPVREPFAFLAQLAYNLPVLLSAQLGGPSADLAFWGEPSQRGVLLVLSLCVLMGIGFLCAPLLRRDRQARFWALGMLLAAVPVSASLPGERLLLVVSIGAAPLLARLFVATFELGPSEARASFAGVSIPKLRRLLVLLLLLLHGVAAAFAAPVRAHAMEWLGRAIDRADASVPSTPEIAGQTLIIVNAPFNVMVSYLQAARQARGIPRPRQVHWLASASSELAVTRKDEHSLELSLREGFLRTAEERHYRKDASELGVGASVMLSELSLRVQELTADARPRTVEARFAHPLHDARYRFVAYRDGQLVPWRAPAVGQGETFPAARFFDVVASEIFR